MADFAGRQAEMTKRKSKAERENDARNRAAMKKWTKKLATSQRRKICNAP